MRRNQLFVIHILYWIYLLVVLEIVDMLVFNSRSLTSKAFFIPMALSNYFIFPLPFYINYAFVLPRFLKKKQYVKTILSWLILIGIFISFRYFVQEYLFLTFLGQCNFCGLSPMAYITRNFFQAFTYLILAGTLIWFTDDWLKVEKQKRQLWQEKLQAEKALLQLQVSPHFLFNTLNNIYSMVFHQSQHSLSAIHKLSEIMRYALKETGSDWVPLQVEISYMKSFITLQTYRARQPAIAYTETGDFTDLYIPPMLLISFVENAFKHGVLNDKEHPISIQLIAEKNKLTFWVVNKINKNSKDVSSGIGLASVKKRLEIYYPSKHELITEEKESIYSSKLNLTY